MTQCLKQETQKAKKKFENEFARGCIAMNWMNHKNFEAKSHNDPLLSAILCLANVKTVCIVCPDLDIKRAPDSSIDSLKLEILNSVKNDSEHSKIF